LKKVMDYRMNRKKTLVIILYTLYVLGIFLTAVPYQAEVSMSNMDSSYTLRRTFTQNGMHEDNMFNIVLINPELPGQVTVIYQTNPTSTHTLKVESSNIKTLHLDCQKMFDKWEDRVFKENWGGSTDYYKTYFVERDHFIVNVNSPQGIQDLQFLNTPQVSLVKFNGEYLTEGDSRLKYVNVGTGVTGLTNIPDGGDNTIELWFSSTDMDFDGILDQNDDDADGDGLNDAWEEKYGGEGNLDIVNDPLADTDNDGVSNQEEMLKGTNPSNSDTDGDGYSDEEEISEGTDPLNRLDIPAEKAGAEESFFEENCMMLLWLLIIVIVVVIVLAIVVLKRRKEGPQPPRPGDLPVVAPFPVTPAPTEPELEYHGPVEEEEYTEEYVGEEYAGEEYAGEEYVGEETEAEVGAEPQEEVAQEIQPVAPVQPEAPPEEADEEMVDQTSDILLEAEEAINESREQGIDTLEEADAELEKARDAFGERDYENAQNLAKNAANLARGENHKAVIEALKDVRVKILEAKKVGTDITEAEELFAAARPAMVKKDYRQARELIQQAHAKLEGGEAAVTEAEPDTSALFEEEPEEAPAEEEPEEAPAEEEPEEASAEEEPEEAPAEEEPEEAPAEEEPEEAPAEEEPEEAPVEEEPEEAPVEEEPEEAPAEEEPEEEVAEEPVEEEPTEEGEEEEEEQSDEEIKDIIDDLFD